MARVLIGLSDLTEEKQQEIIEAYESEIGRQATEDTEELVWIQMDIDDEGDATYV